MQKTCTQCSAQFEVTDDDLALLDKISPIIAGKKQDLPPPTMCFDCRLQRRLAFYNCRTLHKRICDFTKKPIVSIYSPDKPFTVYEKEVWYGDKWDPLEFGREFDFSRPFFQQFAELHKSVPQMSLSQMGYNQNSEYTNDNYKLKNCYLMFDGEQAEDCLYGHTFVGVKNCVDIVFLNNSELCFQCVHCNDCYGLRYSRYCKNSWDSWFLKDCIGCKHCFGCVNLRQKEYCIFNEQKTREEYEQFMKEFETGKHSVVAAMQKKVEAFFRTQPVKAVRGEQNIDCTGGNIDNCKNSYNCFDSIGIQDCRHCTDCLMGAKDCVDIHAWGNNMELSYNSCIIGDNIRNIIAGYYVLEGCQNISYSIFCTRSCSNLFGCISLRHKQYCIFNKQYTKEEYEDLVPRIIEHMKSMDEWGEFFPAEISAFGYNETMASVFFPLSKEQTLQKGWQWSDYEAPVEAEKSINAAQLPDDIRDIPDDILNWAIVCEKTGKQFKVIEQELRFYRTYSLPIPHRHPDQRHADRCFFKNPYKLWQRQCGKCQKDIQTSCAPKRPEKVYCEECYLAEVY